MLSNSQPPGSPAPGHLTRYEMFRHSASVCGHGTGGGKGVFCNIAGKKTRYEQSMVERKAWMTFCFFSSFFSQSILRGYICSNQNSDFFIFLFVVSFSQIWTCGLGCWDHLIGTSFRSSGYWVKVPWPEEPALCTFQMLWMMTQNFHQECARLTASLLSRLHPDKHSRTLESQPWDPGLRPRLFSPGFPPGDVEISSY